MIEAKALISEAMRERYSPGKVIEDIQFEADEYVNTLKNIPIGIDDVIKTIRGYRIERLQAKGDIIKKYRLLDEVSKNVFLAVVLLTSAYLIIRGEGNVALLGFLDLSVEFLRGYIQLLVLDHLLQKSSHSILRLHNSQVLLLPIKIPGFGIICPIIYILPIMVSELLFITFSSSEIRIRYMQITGSI